jgi:membrane-bound metal-dependent hydrolase YbcI (DUF457 family)
MPSPIGHGLGGLAAGWIVAEPPRAPRAAWLQAIIFAAVGAAPDLDLLIGHHREAAHSVGAAAIVASVAAIMRWPVAPTRTRVWLAIFAAWASHALLDALGTDTAPPVGIMAFWPFSHAYVMTAWHLFGPISRRWHEAGWITGNIPVALHEMLIMAPVAAGVWIARRLSARRRFR